MRATDQQFAMWDQAVTEVRARLARIDRGESWAPAQMVRCLRVFAAPIGRPADLHVRASGPEVGRRG